VRLSETLTGGSVRELVSSVSAQPDRETDRARRGFQVGIRSGLSRIKGIYETDFLVGRTVVFTSEKTDVDWMGFDLAKKRAVACTALLDVGRRPAFVTSCREP
jgi:hypothetical protein